jgi:hypothetical protein
MRFVHETLVLGAFEKVMIKKRVLELLSEGLTQPPKQSFKGCGRTGTGAEFGNGWARLNRTGRRDSLIAD